MNIYDVEKLKGSIKNKKIQNWKQVHDFYKGAGNNYPYEKLQHAYTSLMEVLNITTKQFDLETFRDVLEKTLELKTWMCKGIYESREKDYKNAFRKMVYDTKEEMEKVVGKLEDNSFIQQELKVLDQFKKEVASVMKKIN